MARVLAALALPLVSADVYMQYPPGGNNRLDEGGGNRNNNNRCATAHKIACHQLLTTTRSPTD